MTLRTGQYVDSIDLLQVQRMGLIARGGGGPHAMTVGSGHLVNFQGSSG